FNRSPANLQGFSGIVSLGPPGGGQIPLYPEARKCDYLEVGGGEAPPSSAEWHWSLEVWASRCRSVPRTLALRSSSSTATPRAETRRSAARVLTTGTLCTQPASPGRRQPASTSPA